MFCPEWCDDDGGNDQHDSWEDESDGEETGQDSQSGHFSLQQVVQPGPCLPAADREVGQLLVAGTRVEFPHHSSVLVCQAAGSD